MIQPTIIVSTYNRLHSLNRLLNSLLKSDFSSFENVRLIISVDKHKDDEQEILDFLKNFQWPFGEFLVKTYSERLGLKKHFIKCCDFSLEYGSIIFLEDDFMVSRSFYEYATQAVNFYKENSKIAGVCLYDLVYNEFSNRNFTALLDNNDQYFMQLVSWGKIFTKEQWSDFKDWFISEKGEGKEQILPKVVQKWSNRSFKKEYIKYLISENKFFVFPRKSFVTNYGDKGEHFQENDTKFQRPIRVDVNTGLKFNFVNIEDSLVVYDVYMEIIPDRLKILNNELKEYDFSVDLYGIKPIKKIETPYVITSKNVRKYVTSYGRVTLPHETNVVFNNDGDYFYLAETKDVIGRRKSFRTYFKDSLYDDSGISPLKLLFIDIWKSILKAKNFFK
jgi:hypothetical protein